MKYPKLILALIFIVSVSYAIPQVQKEVSVQPGQKLVVDLECGSDIIIEGWDKDVVEADINIYGRDANDLEIEITETSYGVLVKAEFEHRSKNTSTSGEVKVMVPNKFDLDLKTMGGQLSVSNVDGDLEGTTMGGSLNLESLKGEVDFSTMGGSIQLVDSEVDGEVSTMGGSVIIENVVGDVNASTMGGSVTQRNVKSSKSAMGKEVKIESMGGSIRVDEAMTGANVKTMGGSITVNKAAEYVKAETMGGDIEIKEVAGWVDATTMGGNVEVNMKGSDGNRDVKLKSMGGDITLYVPSDLSMDIDIEIIYDEDDEEDIDIISDFSLDEKVFDNVGKWGDDNKKLIANGKTGDGANRIKIETIGGKVYLKKR